MTIPQEIQTILASPEDDSDSHSRAEQIEQLIPRLGWPLVRDAILEILAAQSPADHYQLAASVLWGAVLDKRDLPADRVIALLYHRFDPRADNEDNLVWSITSKLRGVGYLSDYHPFNDPRVIHELDILRKREPTLPPAYNPLSLFTYTSPPRTSSMSIQTLGKQFVELCNQGKNFDVMKTMYDDNIVSVEASGHETAGKEAVIEKSKRWASTLTIQGEKMLGPYFSAPDQFAVHITFDVTPKSTGVPVSKQEVGVYTVKNDKITREQFFNDGKW